MITLPCTRNDLIEKIVPPDSVGAEIGVLSGAFSYKLLRLPIRKLFMVDPWREHKDFAHDGLNRQEVLDDALRQAETYNRNDLDCGRAIIVREFSADAAKSWFAKFRPRLDWVYIDANHSYAAALQDHLLWEEVLKPDGFIMGHDYLEHPDCGVVQAVDFFCRTRGWEIEYLTSDSNQGVPTWENIVSYSLRRK